MGVVAPIFAGGEGWRFRRLPLLGKHLDEANRPMFIPSSFPCVAWRINQFLLPVPVIVEQPYAGLYHTEHDLYLCEGGWLLHASELYESLYHTVCERIAAVEVAT